MGEYEQLFRDQFSRMAGLARLLGADDPENIAQEAFVRLHDRIGGLRNEGSARAYLRSTVVNLTRTRTTHLAMARRTAARFPPPVAVTQDGAANRAELAVLSQALSELAPGHREAVVLRYWLDLSLEDVATAMGVRLGTAKSQVSRALTNLRELLTDRQEAK